MAKSKKKAAPKKTYALTVAAVPQYLYVSACDVVEYLKDAEAGNDPLITFSTDPDVGDEDVYRLTVQVTSVSLGTTDYTFIPKGAK
jgi:hypothetical protein